MLDDAVQHGGDHKGVRYGLTPRELKPPIRSELVKENHSATRVGGCEDIGNRGHVVIGSDDQRRRPWRFLEWLNGVQDIRRKLSMPQEHCFGGRSRSRGE